MVNPLMRGSFHSGLFSQCRLPGGPTPCHGPADAPLPSSALPPSASWIVENLDRGPCLIIIHNVCHIHSRCCNSVTLLICTHDIYCFCPSWRGILLCCSPEGFFPFFPCECFFFNFWGVFPGEESVCYQPLSQVVKFDRDLLFL